MTEHSTAGNAMGSGVWFDGSRSADATRLEQAHPGEHVWIAAAAFRLQPESLRRGAAALHLDMENLASVDIGCYVCEKPYSERLSYRACPGEPPVGTP